VSWTTLLLLAAGAFAFKAAGMFGVGRFAELPVVVGLGRLLPAALLAALIVDGTFNTDGALVVDERAAGVLLGGLAAWYRAPFWLVVLVAAGTTALLRQL
jgi:hypothetical protein